MIRFSIDQVRCTKGVHGCILLLLDWFTPPNVRQNLDVVLFCGKPRTVIRRDSNFKGDGAVACSETEIDIGPLRVVRHHSHALVDLYFMRCESKIFRGRESYAIGACEVIIILDGEGDRA